MANNPNNLSENKKVYFITSNPYRENTTFDYSLKNYRAIINLLAGEKSEYRVGRIYSNDKYIISICSFEIIPSDLTDDYKSKKNKKYKAKVTLRTNKTNCPFLGYIYFRKRNKNNFIYDFKFNDNISKWTLKKTNAPASITFSKYEQFQLYSEFLKIKKVKAKDDINIDFIQDSQFNYSCDCKMDFFMAIFKRCVYQKEIKLFILSFKLDKSSLPENFKYKEYSSILDLIEKNAKEEKFLKDENNKFKFYVKFYTLLFYLRRHFEKEKAEAMILDKSLFKYFSDFLPKYSSFFPNLICPEELIDKMFEGKLSYDIIKGILGYAGSVEKILLFLNKYFLCIKSFFLQEKRSYIMSDLGNAQETDNLSIIYEEICKFIDFEKMEKNIVIVSFDENFWQLYISFNEELKNLDIINKSISKCSELQYDLSKVKLELNYKFHNRLIYDIDKGKLKNEELLDFINLDYFFSEKNKDYKNYKHERPYLVVINGLEFETMTDAFYEKWKKLNLFKIFNYDINNFKINLIAKLSDIKNFGKLLKLFDYKNPSIFDGINTRNSLAKKFKEIINTFKIETCPNFKEDIAYYIYIMDYADKKNIQDFLKNIIEKHIQFIEIKRDIYLYLAANYKDISNNVIDCIGDFLTSNKFRLNADYILFILEKIGNKKVIKNMLNKLEFFIIKDEEIFSKENNIESLKLLEGILQRDLLNKCPEIRETKYLMKTIEIGENVLKNIKSLEIKYTSYIKVWEKLEFRKDFEKKLKILLFNNEDDLKLCKEKFDNVFKETVKQKTDLEKLLSILNEFYKKKYKNEILEIEEFKIKLLSGNINQFENKDVKNKIEEFKAIFTNLAEEEEIKKEMPNFPDFSLHNYLKQSVFFTHMFRNIKAKNITKTDTQIMIISLKQFALLEHFFKGEWINKIDDSIIKECYKALKENKSEIKIDNNKNKSMSLIEKELINLADYFKVNKQEKIMLKKLEDDLITYSQKEDIFLTANSCIHFINILGAKKTEFFDELLNIRTDIKKNISFVKIKQFGQAFEKYGLKIIDSENEDRDYLDILQNLSEKENSLKFLVDHKGEDFRTLQELVTEAEQSFLTGNEIRDMIECNKFIQSLIREEQTDKELIKDFVKLVQEHKGITAVFKNYTTNSGQIIELFDKKLDKSQANLKKIKNIMISSKFILSMTNKKEQYLQFKGNYTDIDDKTEKQIYFEEIKELRGRAMLTKKLGEEKSKEEKEIFKYNESYAKRVNEIEKINQLLEKLGEKGYSEKLEIIIDIKETNPEFKMDDTKLENYDECSQLLNNLLDKTTETQINYYNNKETELIRYLFGRQFTLFKDPSNNNLKPFLKFLTNDSGKTKNLDKINFKYDSTLHEDKYICLMENINNFLTNFLVESKLTLKSIYSQNMVKKKYENEFIGLYTYLLEHDKTGEVQKGIEEHILDWYYFLTDHPPMAQNVLLCNEETTSEEITAFLYRAFLCEYNVVFMMGKIELLKTEPSQTLTNLINSLFTLRGKKINSCVVFAYSQKGVSIADYVESIPGRKYLEHKKKAKLEEKSYDENVEIIYSDKTGVGKSRNIKLRIEEEKKKKYIYFPFGGEFTRKEIIKRLNEIIITDEEKTVIHLDLYDSKQIDLMKDFLYCFLVTKLYGQNENLFYLSKKVEIMVEIPCGFVDFFKKFPILSMFKKRKLMSVEHLPKLIVNTQINSNVQIVCNYLKYLKLNKLADKDIIIKGVSLSSKDLSQLVIEDYIPESTYEDAKVLSSEECFELIKQYIGIPLPSYYQINSFIDVLAGQLRDFSINIQMSAAHLIQCENMFKSLKGTNLKNLRVTMVNSFIKNTVHFTQGAFESLLNSQESAYKIALQHGKYNENDQNVKAFEALQYQKEIISCSSIKPALVFFHEGGGQEFSIITNDQPNSKEYNNLLDIRKIPVMIQNQYYKNEKKEEKIEELPKKLKNYNVLEHKNFLTEIKKILNINNPIDNEHKDPEHPEIKSIEEIVGDYVFTADNFVKMILILLRIRANIPVIMMGETGCGKTSLIRKLYELMNNGVCNMEILNIHAGVTDNEILHFLYDNKRKDKDGGEIPKSSIIAKAKILEEEEDIKQKNFEEMDQKYNKKKFWVFLDEINTCNSMGLISEMMTKKSCLGKPLPDNIFFIAACNPYKNAKITEEQNALEVVNEKKSGPKLVYTVNPLPFSLLNFVFNFGELTKEDEKSYIKNMIISPIESFFWKEIEEKNKEEKLDKINIGKYLKKDEVNNLNSLKKLASEAITIAHQYVREKNDVSSVSLREIRRFGIFYSFMVEYLRKKKLLDSQVNQNEKYNVVDTYYKDLTNFEIYKYSINISIYLCYYIRLTNKDYRKELSNKIGNIFGKDYDFEKMPIREEKYIADNIEMEKGIAKNRALLENLFTLFVCVNSKIPLFIVGKPGCSKSLSVQLLFKTMKGNSSDNTLFKSLPQLFINSYQGSKGSTSKGVLNIFKKARLMLNNDNKDKIISMIYFDEMGLAENSPNNPLKVIHSELEYDLNEGDKKVAFVGISNWCLDASKMNRGLYLSIPQPDLEDLNKTSLTIAESYNPHLAQENLDLFEALANVYFKYKIELKTNYPDKKEYHGSRDFYHLIKIAMRQLLEKVLSENNEIDDHIKEGIGINSIERNFAGLEFDNKISSLKIIKTIFKEKYPNCDTESNYNVIEKIRENIKDKDSRYLLLISKSSVSNYLINSILNSNEMRKDLKKELSFYIGSGFIKDQLSESYGLSILNKIQLQMEQDKILLLADLESVYPSLYDLFNQNFTIASGKKYSRIAMGSSNNTFSLVNDGFKVIVFVDKHMIEEEDPPFLNRFEKHIISFEVLLRKELLQEAINIYNIIQDLGRSDIKPNKMSIKYNLQRLLFNCDKEEIQGMIYIKDIEYQNLNNNNLLKVQEIQDLVLEKISLTLSQDLILIMKYSGFKEKYMNVYNKILEFYKKGEHSNLHNFLKTMKNLKNVIYTFTNIQEPLLKNISGKFNTEMFGLIDRTNIKEIQISSLYSENELEAQLESIYLDKDNKTKIIVIKFNPDETDIMNYVKFFIENYLKEKNYLEENLKKAFIFTIHIKRLYNDELKDEKKAEYITKNTLGESISHLSDFYQICIDHLNGENFSLIDILDLKAEDLFKICLKLNSEFNDNFYNATSFFDYDFPFSVKGIDKSNYTDFLINFLKENLELRQYIIKSILKHHLGKIDILEEFLKNSNFTKIDNSIITVIQQYLSELFTRGLAKFILKAEMDNFLSTFIFNQVSNNKIPLIEKNKIIIIDEEEDNLLVIDKEKEEEIRDKNEIKEENKNYYLGNNVIKKLIELYLENLDISNVNIKPNKNENKLSITLGLRLPGIFPLIKIFRQYVKDEIKFEFFDTERCIKFYLNPDRNEFHEKLQEYENELKNYFKSTEIEIGKNPIFKKLIELNKEFQNDFDEFITLLLEDYYLIYLSEIINDIKDSYKNIKEYNKILKKMIFLRYESDNEGGKIEPFKSFVMKLIWLESYSQHITILISIYKRISLYENNLFDKVEKLLNEDQIKFDLDERKNPEYTQIYLKPFYFILESLLRIIITDFNLYNNLKDQKFYDFINVLKTISKDGLNLTEDLKIYSKEIFTIQQFLDIEKRLNKFNKSNPENNLKVLNILLKQSQYSNDINKLDELSVNIKKLYDFLYENLGDTNNFTELILIIFVAEIKKQSSDNYRQTLVEIVLNNPKLIAYSYPFISIIIKGVAKSKIADIGNNLENLQNSQSGCLELINNSKQRNYS